MSPPRRLAVSILLGMSVLYGCTSVGQITTLSDARCHDSLTGALAKILVSEGETPEVAKQLADSTADALQTYNFGPRPFYVGSPSGTDYSFFVEPQDASCVLRLYERQKGFVNYTNNLTYIATEPLAPCQCSEEGTAPSAAPPPVAARSPVVPIYEAQRGVDDYIRSGRYDADFAEVVAAAKSWLEERAPSATKPAIVLDIDETSLSNWPAYRVNGWARIVNGDCDLEKGPCGLRAWQKQAESKALAPTLALARRARELGVAVFFISGRPPELREATEQNLRSQGYEWTEVVLLPAGRTFPSAVDFKAPERRRISEEGYTIVLSLGDQESDLAGGFAERTFQLPNPVYYLP